MDERRLTFIIVPHGDLETRTYNISYRRLKVVLGVGIVLVVAFIVMIASWWAMAAQIARLPRLERELAELEAEQAKLDELARTLAQVEAQYERVRRLLGADAIPEGRESWLPPLSRAEPAAGPGPDATNLVNAWPLTKAGFITQELTAGSRNHPGLDIAVPNDSYIRAAGPGVVRDAGVDDVYGRFVLIDHGDGMESMYGHASRTFVQVGDTVERHEVIALSGSTGRSTAPHLHFEIRRNGEPVDPFMFVQQP